MTSSPLPCHALQTQYLTAISRTGTNTHNYQEDIFSWIIIESHLSHPPKVTSISYGYLENELLSYPQYLNSFNVEAMKLAIQGVTIVASSGDSGVANFIAEEDVSECSYNPVFPASNPYVLG
jgi:subtilase family serine protease